MYIVWGLLPFVLFMMAIWGWLKPILKVPGKDDAWGSFKMAVFCSLALIVSIYIDKSEHTANLVDSVTLGYINIDIVRFLIYPAILLLMAKASDYWKERKSKSETQAKVS
jgi:hypothetical protein